MPLFGSMRRGLPAGAAAYLPPPKPTEVLPKPNAPRRGLFGRIGQVLTPDRLQGLGAALIDAGTGSNTFNDVVAEQRMRPYLEEEMQGRRMDRKNDVLDRQTAQQQRTRSQALAQQYIATLPPEQQQQALLQFTLDPDGFAERIQGPQFEARPGMTHTTAIDPITGQVIQGGALPLRPRAPTGGGSNAAPELPSGFQWAD